MASLGKHGDCVIVEFTWHKTAFCQDRTVLRNHGNGWKVYGKLKANVDYKAHADKVKRQRDEDYASMPCVKAFMEWINSNVKSYAKRAYLRTGLSLLHDDPDGLWSELQDDYNAPHLDYEDCEKACRLYVLAVEEARAHRIAKASGPNPA